LNQTVTLANGVEGLYIPSARFKTTRISVSFLLPLQRETISANTLLPAMLTTSSAEYPDYRSLQTRLAELYGASLGASSGKVGDAQILTLTLTALDDRFVPEGKVAADCAALLSGMIFRPNLDENGRFKSADLEREKRLLLETIEGELNDKRLYALNRAEAALFDGEVYGLPQYGTAEGAAALTCDDLHAAWLRALEEAQIRVTIVSSCPPDDIFAVFGAAFSKQARRPASLQVFGALAPVASPRRVAEEMEVAQGKLVMAFRTGVTGGLLQTAAFSVMCDLFGGGPYSRLFANVREKLSLCYYCAARSNRFKGILLVDSGVEKQNAAAAEREILAQLKIMQEGAFEDDELAASILSKADRIRSMFDSQRETESFYMSQIFDDRPCTAEELLAAVSAVTRADVTQAARLVEPALTYLLSPKGK
jgi:predicted Zn-dependent peptidase